MVKFLPYLIFESILSRLGYLRFSLVIIQLFEEYKLQYLFLSHHNHCIRYQTKIGQKIGFLPKILSAKKICLPKILSTEFLSDMVYYEVVGLRRGSGRPGIIFHTLVLDFCFYFPTLKGFFVSRGLLFTLSG